MQRAIDKRDTAVIVAADKYHADLKKALETRRDELKKAWEITEAKERRKAIRTVWDHYRKSVKDARKVMREARHTTWKQFYTDRRQCGIHALSDDSTNESADIHLQ